MARKGKRVLAFPDVKNIYMDAGGFDITMMVRGITDSQRYHGHAHSKTFLLAERSAMHTRLNDLADKRAAGAGVPGTMLGDAKKFLDMNTALDREAITNLVMQWVHALGPQTKRKNVTHQMIATVIAKWSTEPQAHTKLDPITGKRQPYSREKIRKQLRALRQMWAMLDGKDASNPARAVDMPSPPKAEKRNIDLDLADRIIADMADQPLHQARADVILQLGVRHCEIMRLRAHHIDWQHGTITILGSKKGGGTNPRVLPFGAIDKARAALLHFCSFKTFGKFKQDNLRTPFKAAAMRQGAHEGIRPYDLRHTCGTELYKRTRDIHVVQRWLGHAKVETTMRYILGATDDSLMNAALAMNAWHATRGVDAKQPPDNHVH